MVARFASDFQELSDPSRRDDRALDAGLAVIDCDGPRTGPGSPPASNRRSIKMLDPLTRRFHAGVVRGISGQRLEILVPPSPFWRAGQRVRFALESDAPRGIVSRAQMQPAVITQIQSTDGAALRINLTRSVSQG